MGFYACTILLAVLIVGSAITPALGAQLEATLNPDVDSSPFKITYQRTAFIEYPVGSPLSEHMQTNAWILEGSAGIDDPGVQRLQDSLNQNIRGDGAISSVNDLSVEYSFQLTGRNVNTSLDFKVQLEGYITGYVITKDQLRTLIDMGWRGLSTDESIIIDGIDVNIPLNMLQESDPSIYNLVRNTEAGDILATPMINADFILEQPLENWHFLFDPTGINVDAGLYGISDELAGQVRSSWTMGESSIREGIQVEREWHASVAGSTHPDIPGAISFDLRAVQSADQANLHALGFGAIDRLEGVEIIGVTPTAPDDFATTSTGNFPVVIIYGMAGLAAIGGVAFFVFSSRSLKKEKQGQQGIDPAQLVGYQTSAASGGYQTNRGEAQLRDDSDYQQTRSYYEEMDTSEPDTEYSDTEDSGSTSASDSAPTTDSIPAPTCACTEMLESSSECDCQMQTSCYCDSTCQCPSQVCIDATR